MQARDLYSGPRRALAYGFLGMACLWRRRGGTEVRRGEVTEPMFLVKVSDFLQMTGPPPSHEQLVLKAS